MGKRLENLKKKTDCSKTYTIAEAVNVVQSNAIAKYDESIDLIMNLNIDAKKTDQNMRGAIELPHGSGRKCIVAVFAQNPDKIEEAKKSGADIVGGEDLIQTILSGDIAFDVCVATPDMMGMVGRVAKVLGPKGLMPNPKLGTVTNDVAATVQSLKAGRIAYKNDKAGVLHMLVGKASFTPQQLTDNIQAVVQHIKSHKPPTAKGVLVKSIYLTSTQGIAVMLDHR